MNDARAWLESTKTRGMALGLQHTKAVLDRLNLAHTPEHILHVAGSNGKGTVCALMAGALTLAGTPNILFSSPHLIRVEERIRFNGNPIDQATFDAALDKIARASHQKPRIQLTFFEITYLAAMQCASDTGVEVLILETGLGGRKDATRAGPASASLVTSISTEHRDILGNSLAQIAKEKAAIARPGAPILIRRPPEQAVEKAMLEEVGQAGQVILQEQQVPAHPEFISIPTDVSVRNEALILGQALFQKVGLPGDRLTAAYEQVQWPARMQHVQSNHMPSHRFLLDAAHNPSGLKRVLPELERQIRAAVERNGDGWCLVFGTSPQFDLEAFCQPLISLCKRIPPACIVLTEPQGGRYPAVACTELAALQWPCNQLQVEPLPSIALDHLKSIDPSRNGFVVSLGSLYLQGNILEALGLSSNEDLSLLAKQ